MGSTSLTFACVTAAHKRVCPLCKGPINGYWHDIRSDTSFREVTLPTLPQHPTNPPSAAQSGNPSHASSGAPPSSSALTILQSLSGDAYNSRDLWALQLALLGTPRGGGRDAWRGSASSSAAVPGRSGSRQAGRGNEVRHDRAQGTGSSREGGSGRASHQEPRPYYLRLRRGIAAGGS